MGETAKKILSPFRVSDGAFNELNSLAEESGMSKTDIIEIAILNVRPIIEKKLKHRSNAVGQGSFRISTRVSLNEPSGRYDVNSTSPSAAGALADKASGYGQKSKPPKKP